MLLSLTPSLDSFDALLGAKRMNRRESTSTTLPTHADGAGGCPASTSSGPRLPPAPTPGRWPAAPFPCPFCANMITVERDMRRIRRASERGHKLPAGQGHWQPRPSKALPPCRVPASRALAAGEFGWTARQPDRNRNPDGRRTSCCAHRHALVEAGHRVFYTRQRSRAEASGRATRPSFSRPAWPKLDKFEP